MSEDESNQLFEEQQDEEGEPISGWADSMLKILKSTKPKNKKNLILSRARKDYEVSKATNLKKPKFKRKDDFDFEIEKDTDKPKVEDSAETKKKDEKEDKKSQDTLSLKQQRKLELKQRKLERAWENLNRLTTETTDREMERDLLKIATKGVVQLFNAVSQQQKSLKTKLKASGKSEFKKDKVMSESKDLFNKAMNKHKIIGSTNEDGEVEIKEEDVSSDEEPTMTSNSLQRKRKASATGSEGTSSKKPVWQALQDDFMLDAKLKDWDKDSDSD